MFNGRFRRGKIRSEIHPEEILIDSENISEFDVDQFEGRIERPIKQSQLVAMGGAVALVAVLLFVRAGMLQVVHGAEYALRAEQNQLAEETIFADRGTIVDRNGVPLAWSERLNVEDDFARRVYADRQGLAHAVGYTRAPAKDSSGNYFRTAFEGLDGAERAYDGRLGGTNGVELTETDALGRILRRVAGSRLAGDPQMPGGLPAHGRVGDPRAARPDQAGGRGGNARTMGCSWNTSNKVQSRRHDNCANLSAENPSCSLGSQ